MQFLAFRATSGDSVTVPTLLGIFFEIARQQSHPTPTAQILEPIASHHRCSRRDHHLSKETSPIPIRDVYLLAETEIHQ
jgi:hypothetical protein